LALAGAVTGAGSEVAERYANALFELATQAKAMDAAEAALKELARAIAGSDDLRHVLASPLFPAIEKVKALTAIAGAVKAPELVRNFLGVVAANGRSAQLSVMVKTFLALAAKARGATIARVATAAPLSKTELQALAAALKSALGAAAEIETEVQPDLIGGMIVKVGSRQFDSSIKTKLDTLKAQMKGA
jgi:F-type H+-transporting ATPase subunit delta